MEKNPDFYQIAIKCSELHSRGVKISEIQREAFCGGDKRQAKRIVAAGYYLSGLRISHATEIVYGHTGTRIITEELKKWGFEKRDDGPARKAIDNQDKIKCVEMYVDGASPLNIAKIVFGNKNHQMVTRIIGDAGVSLRGNYKVSPEEEAEIVRLYVEEGYGMKAVSKIVFGSEKKSTIRGVLDRNGVETRDQNQSKKLSPAWKTRRFGRAKRSLTELERHRRQTEAKSKKNRTIRTYDLELFEYGASKRAAEQWRERYNAEPGFRSFQIVRSRFKKITKGAKKDSTWRNFIGCTKREFESWLECQFDEKMRWDNQGDYWHIDHVVPCKWFDHSKEEDVALCWNYQNMRPLSAEENMRKGARHSDCFEWLSNQKQTDIIKGLKSRALQYL